MDQDLILHGGDDECRLFPKTPLPQLTGVPVEGTYEVSLNQGAQPEETFSYEYDPSASPAQARDYLFAAASGVLMGAIGGVIGCKQFSWLRGVGCGLSSAFEYGGPCCDRCGAGVWVVPGAHRQNARPVPVGDQGRDQAQRGRRRVLQGRGGRAHGRTPTRPSQGARPRCRPCSAVPCLVRPRPGPNAPPDQRAPQGRSVWQGGHHGRLPSSRWAHDQPRGDLHVDPHAIVEEEPRRSTGSCCPHGVGRARGPPPAGACPRSWACG